MDSYCYVKVDECIDKHSLSLPAKFGRYSVMFLPHLKYRCYIFDGGANIYNDGNIFCDSIISYEDIYYFDTKSFDKYFDTISTYRENKINQVING